MSQPLVFPSSPSDAPLTFALDQEPTAAEHGVWKIMLVDDDPSIHQATKIALKFFSFEGRKLHFISAYSGQEAKALIRSHPDTALILLDVIMETSDAGLGVAQYIREVIQNHLVRIILRTGEPGQVPEASVVLEYDINDYKTKLELTQQKLFTTLVSSLRSFRDLIALQESQENLAGANRELQDLNQNLEHLVQARTLALEQKNQQLAREIEERQRAEEALRLYIHALTHDLRNPVTGMSTVLKSLRTRPVKSDKVSPQIEVPMDVLERMSAGCDRLLKMIGTLIDAHKIDVWGVSLQRQPLCLTEVIQALSQEWAASFERKRMNVTYQVEAGLPLVHGDRDQLWRVFENIFANVVKYNPPGIDVSVTLAVTTEQPRMIGCKVKDTGIGIESAQLPNLFKLYSQSRPRPVSGLGLGLYICRQIVEAHGGKIWMSSELGKGSECCVLLPMIQG